MSDKIEALSEMATTDEIKADIAAYTKSLIAGDYETGMRIERKYDLFGASPEYVSITLNDLLSHSALSELDRLRSSSTPMADGGETPMTAAEEVLAWLLVEKIGVPDDVPYSPSQAQEIISRHLDRAKELDQIADMLAAGQGDDDGPAILPEFEKGSSVLAKVEACLHLLERRRDALSTLKEEDAR